jgi:hypothetical protein
MKTRITKLAYGATLSLLAAPALADTAATQGANDAKPTGAPGSLSGSGGAFHTIADTLIFIVGAVAVIMLIIGGLRYVISQGDAAQVKAAKDTILYSILVAILAYAIVAFISGALSK